jgi:small subunit ribosomal protein S1
MRGVWMLERPFAPPSEKGIEMIDEGWWAAILADENSRFPEEQESFSRTFCQEGFSLNWQLIKKIHQNDEIVRLIVHDHNWGGLLVKGNDVQGFIPVSHLVDMPNSISEDERIGLLSDYVGRELKLKVIECDLDQGRVVLSERAALSGEGQRKHLLENLKRGDVVNGLVTNVTDFGVFVDIGGVEGLIHLSELSWGRVQHPSHILHVGQKINTLVMEVCEENARIALSYKRLFENPWDHLMDRYSVGDIVPAIVSSVVHFGAFAWLEDGVEGLIHMSSMGESEGKIDMSLQLHQREPILVRILHIDVIRRRLGLALVKPE